MEIKVKDLLFNKAKISEEKEIQYGSTYYKYGEVMDIIFGGVELSEKKDWDRLGVYSMLVHKMLRLGNKLFDDSVSIDSIQDIQVYGAILEKIVLEDRGGNCN